MRRAASQIALLVLLFVAVQPSVAKVVVDAKPSAASLSVPDRTVSLTTPTLNDRSTAAQPNLPDAAPKDPHPFVTEFYGTAAQSAATEEAKEEKPDWKTKRLAQVRNAWKKVTSWIF